MLDRLNTSSFKRIPSFPSQDKDTDFRAFLKAVKHLETLHPRLIYNLSKVFKIDVQTIELFIDLYRMEGEGLWN